MMGGGGGGGGGGAVDISYLGSSDTSISTKNETMGYTLCGHIESSKMATKMRHNSLLSSLNIINVGTV